MPPNLRTREQYTQRIRRLQQIGRREPERKQQLQRRVAYLRDRRAALPSGQASSMPPPDPDPKPPGEEQKPKGVDNQSKKPGTVPSDVYSSYQPKDGAPDPRDHQYWHDVSRLWHQKTSELSQLQHEDTTAQTAYDQLVNNFARIEPQETRDLRRQAASGGALYSSTTDHALADLGIQQIDRRAEAESGFKTEQQLRDTMRELLKQGYRIEEAAALTQAIDRQAEQEFDRPAPPKPQPEKQEAGEGSSPKINKEQAKKRRQTLMARLKRATTARERQQIQRQIRRLEQLYRGE